jgi:hypothetical protein
VEIHGFCEPSSSDKNTFYAAACSHCSHVIYLNLPIPRVLFFYFKMILPSARGDKEAEWPE